MTTVSTAFPPDRVARGVAIKTEYINLGAAGTKFRPARIAVFAQGNKANTYSLDKRRVFSASEVGDVEGYGSPAHLAVQQLLPVNGDGVGSIPVTLFPLPAPTSGPAQAAGDITPSGTMTKTQVYTVKVNNIPSGSITMLKTEGPTNFITKAIAAIQENLSYPMIPSDGTTKLDLLSKWEGLTANDLHIEVEGPQDAELTFVITQPTGGAGTPDLATALTKIGDVWETHAILGLEGTTTVWDTTAAYVEGRWAPEVYKPLRFFSGNNTASVTTVAALTDARKTDRGNVLIPNPGSNDLPIVIAARAVARIAPVANSNPARDYGSQKLTGLTAGPDDVQWTSAQRDFAVKSGLSTIEVKDGVVQLSDVVTMYHPVGEEPPPYRYECDSQKVETVIYNTDLIFNNEEWDGAPLVPDAQAVKNPKAKKPKMALAQLGQMFDNLALDAIIADPDFAKENTTADIDTANPKRLNVREVYKIAGNANVISVDNNFGFNFGGV